MTDGGPAESVEDQAAGQEAAVEPLLELIAELDADARLQALTHSSWTERRIASWGRLAFLGDSVLGLAVAEHLYERFPRSDIGRLTKIHGQVVSGRACAEIAVALGVPAMLERAYPDDFEGGLAPAELVGSERAMASIVESLIGACYLQFGLDRTAEALARAGVAIMTNGPGTGPMPPVMRLRAAGVTVFAGSDNIRDAWWPYGNGDMLERASLIGYLQGLDTDEELHAPWDLATSAAARSSTRGVSGS